MFLVTFEKNNRAYHALNAIGIRAKNVIKVDNERQLVHVVMTAKELDLFILTDPACSFRSISDEYLQQIQHRKAFTIPKFTAHPDALTIPFFKVKENIQFAKSSYAHFSDDVNSLYHKCFPIISRGARQPDHVFYSLIEMMIEELKINRLRSYSIEKLEEAKKYFIFKATH